MLVRLILSIVAVSVFGWSNYFLSNAGTLIASNASVHQLDNSDLSYLVATPLTQFAGHLALPGLLLIAILLLIWYAPLRRLFVGAGVIVLLAMGLPHPVQAYYDKYDYTEAIYVLPNQSAFVIPDVGANKDSQAQFGSKAYYEQNKVPSKRVVIPHAKLVNSGAWSDYYVPASRVILVNRTPYNKEWVDDEKRGTSKNKEGIPCQSSEGLNITVGISIGVSVAEEGAAKYLYYFGTLPPAGDPRDPQVIFTSVYYARSVSDVMDGIGHGQVAALVCDQLNKLTLQQANQKAGEIIANVRAAATAYFVERGITIDFLGWADTFNFDTAVQKAINDAFVASTVGPAVSTLQAIADMQVKEGLAQGLAKHGLPANLIAIPQNMVEGLSNLFTGKVPGK